MKGGTSTGIMTLVVCPPLTMNRLPSKTNQGPMNGCAHMANIDGVRWGNAEQNPTAAPERFLTSSSDCWPASPFLWMKTGPKKYWAQNGKQKTRSCGKQTIWKRETQNYAIWMSRGNPGGNVYFENLEADVFGHTFVQPWPGGSAGALDEPATSTNHSMQINKSGGFNQILLIKSFLIKKNWQTCVCLLILEIWRKKMKVWLKNGITSTQFSSNLHFPLFLFLTDSETNGWCHCFDGLLECHMWGTQNKIKPWPKLSQCNGGVLKCRWKGGKYDKKTRLLGNFVGGKSTNLVLIFWSEEKNRNFL